MTQNSGMALMLKSLGIDPDQITAMIAGIVQGVQSVNTKLDVINQRLERIENVQYRSTSEQISGDTDEGSE